MAMKIHKQDPAYRPVLDGIRAIAILSVMTSHYAPSVEIVHPGGAIGVRIFFVLSGFLITGILLRAKRDATKVGQRVGLTLKQFYIRRVLRIFPVYYLGLMCAMLLGSQSTPSAKVSLLLFVSNWWMSIKNLDLEFMSPYWSLAVEEQFYMIWPWIVMFTARYRVVAIAMVVLGIGVRLVLASRGESMALWVSTPASVEALGLGSLLAIFKDGSTPLDLRRSASVCGMLGCFLLVASFAKVGLRLNTWLPGLMDLEGFVLGADLLALWAIERGDRDVQGALWTLIASKPMLYIGKISYGLYIYHMLVYRGTEVLLKHMGIEWNAYPKTRVAFMLVSSVLIADLSWRFFERPINDLKRHFPYVKKNSAGAQQAPLS